MEIISREEARDKGLKKFFTGVPCNHGHVSERYVRGGACCQCAKERGEANKENLKRYGKEYRERNKEQIAERKKAWKKNNPDKIREQNKRYRERHKEDLNKYWREYRRERYNTDEEYKSARICRSLVYRVLDKIGTSKEASTFDIVGYSAEEFKACMEEKMIEGMDWRNYGNRWHLDHLYPIARYIADGVDDPAIINGLDNLAPMWAEHNLEKGDSTLEEWLEVKPEMRDIYGYLLEDEA